MEHEHISHQSRKFVVWSRRVRWIWLVLLFITCLFSLLAAMNGDDHFHIAAAAFGLLTLLALVPLIILDRQIKRQRRQ